MPKMTFSLVATIGTVSSDKIEKVLIKLVGKGGISRIEGGFKIISFMK